MSTSRPDAINELIRVLRDQIDRKDERIASLEALLSEANRQLVEQQKLLAAMMARTDGRSPAMPLPEPPIALPESPVNIAQNSTLPSGEFKPAVSHSPTPERIKLPDLGPQIEVIAKAVVDAGARKAELAEAVSEDERDTGKLKPADAPRAKTGKGLKFWKRRERAGNHV